MDFKDKRVEDYSGGMRRRLQLDASKLLFDFICLGFFAAIFATIGVVLSWKYLTK